MLWDEPMGQIGYIRVPGSKTHELPPLLVRSAPSEALEGSAALSSIIGEAEEMLPDRDASEAELEQRKFELALQMTEQYRHLLSHWQWGDSILEWIRQCEITFEYEDALRSLLHPDVWPHAGRASFVHLLVEKHVDAHGVVLERAVGMRLTFRQPPPIDCFSSQFLFYLNSTVADTAYHTWSNLSVEGPALLPPERFHFQVLDLTA